MADSVIEQVNPDAEAAFWHDGRDNPDKKFVIRNTRVDGPPNFSLARAHRDAQFFFIDCVFSERMRDRSPYLVHYPIKGGPPTAADLAANAKVASETVFGVRSWFHGNRRQGGIFPWMSSNLKAAVGMLPPDQITAQWTFGGTWDPEDRHGPRVIDMARSDDHVLLTFDRLVTVKGRPELSLNNGQRARLIGGSGTNRLRFQASSLGGAAKPSNLVFEHGVIVGTEARVEIAPASLRLPRALAR